MIQQRVSVELRANGITSYIVPANELSGTSDSRVTIRQSTDTGAAYSYGNSLIFTGAARQFIFDNIINKPNPYLASVQIILKDLCCVDALGNPMLLFDGRIAYGDIRWCEKNANGICDVEVSFSDNSQTAEALTCLKNVVIFSREYNGIVTNGEDEDRAAVYMVYYPESRPRIFTQILIGIATFIAGLVTTLLAVPTLGLANNGAFAVGATIAESFVRKRFHKAPFISSYLANICKLCGLNLSSSLFQGNTLLRNLTRMDSGIQEGGTDIVEADQIYREFNAPNITATQFLESFRTFNIIYKVSGNTLYVERKDFLSGTLWIDFTANRAQDIIELCFEAGDTQQPAGRVYQYSNDQADKAGNEANRRWSGTVINYNAAANPNLRGVQSVTMPFGAARFLNDGLDSPLANAAANNPFFAGLNSSAMIQQTGTTALPKLLIWDDRSSVNEATVLNQNVNMWLYSGAAQFPNERTVYNELLSIDDPRRNQLKNQRFQLVFAYNCDDLRTFAFEKPILLTVQNQPARGMVEEVSIDYARGQATITGTI